MAIRAIGARAIIRPIETAPPSTLIQVTDYEPPAVGEVLSVGLARCDGCGEGMRPRFGPGDIVLVAPYGGQEVTVDGVLLWSVRLELVLGHWRPDPAPAAVQREGEGL